VKIGKVRRAKLYFLRELRGKIAQRKIKEIKKWEYEAMLRKKEEARRKREEERKEQEERVEETKEETPQESND